MCILIFCTLLLWCSATCATKSNYYSSGLYRVQLPLPSYGNKTLESTPTAHKPKTIYFQNVPFGNKNNATMGIKFVQYKNQTGPNRPLTIKRIVVTNSVTTKPVQSVFWKTFKVNRVGKRNKRNRKGRL